MAECYQYLLSPTDKRTTVAVRSGYHPTCFGVPSNDAAFSQQERRYQYRDKNERPQSLSSVIFVTRYDGGWLGDEGGPLLMDFRTLNGL